MRARPRPSSAGPVDPAAGGDFLLAGQAMTAPKPAPGLFLVATPIGNLGDITLRALETLASVDVIACEDTRVTRKLLDRFGIRTPLKPYHEHNAAEARPALLAALKAGAAIALVSDAGTPLISDPGFKLVREASAAGLHVTTLPGASSVLAALTLAALPTDRFFFEGFLPAKEAGRRTRLGELARIEASLVLFESGHRIREALADLADILGPRPAAICRELTKLHEDVRRGTLSELAAAAAELETRGEFVVVVGPPEREAMPQAELDDILRAALRRGSVKDAVAEGVELSGRPKREVYARALELADKVGSARDEEARRGQV